MRKFNCLFLSLALIFLSFGLKSQIVISEIMYNNPGTDSLEFIELYNNGSSNVDLTGYKFNKGVVYTFPTIILNPGSYLVACIDSIDMLNYFGVNAYKWTSGSLNNSGETIELVDASSNFVDSVAYSSSSPWPDQSNGIGASLEFCNMSLDNNLVSSWSPSPHYACLYNNIKVYASPGTSNCNGNSTSPIISFKYDHSSVIENVSTVTIPLDIFNVNSNPTSIDIVADVSSSAIQGVDYTITSSSTITYPASSSTTQNITISILNDAISESNDTLIINLISPTNNAQTCLSSYKLVIVDDDGSVSFGNCQNLFFSQYIHGSSSNKALQLYNPTQNLISLANYSIQRFSNGATSSSASINLSGTIAPNDVFVIANSSATLSGITNNADLLSAVISHTGNDAYILLNYTDTIDKFGAIGLTGGPDFDIGTTIGGAKSHTLVRNSNVQKGQLDWSIGTNEWTVYPLDDTTGISLHIMDPCVVYVNNIQSDISLKIFPNPVNNNLYIESTENIDEITISDLIGQNLFKVTNVNGNNYKIDLSSLIQGIYFITIAGNNEIIKTLKFIKN